MYYETTILVFMLIAQQQNEHLIPQNASPMFIYGAMVYFMYMAITKAIIKSKALESINSKE